MQISHSGRTQVQALVLATKQRKLCCGCDLIKDSDWECNTLRGEVLWEFSEIYDRLMEM